MSATTKRSDIMRALSRFLEQHKISTWRLDTSGKHPRLIVSHAGRDVFITIPGSSCNRRVHHYAISNLRHALRLVGKEAA